MSRSPALLPAVLAFGLLAAGAPALRAQRLDTTLSVRGRPRLSVSNISGDVAIRSWSRSEVRVQAEFDRADVEVRGTADRVSVRTVSHRHGGDVSYTISVPRGTGIEVNAVSSDVVVGDVCGDLSVQTVSGDVHVDCVDGDAQVQTVSGDVTVSNLRTRHLEVGSTSGDVVVRDLHGGVAAHSVSGDVTLTGIDGDEVTAETVSGDISYDGRIADSGRYDLQAHSGDVVVRTAGPLNAQVSVSTFSGDFTSDYPITLGPGPHNAKTWEFRVGTGSARVRLESFSGAINLRRGAGPSRQE